MFLTTRLRLLFIFVGTTTRFIGEHEGKLNNSGCYWLTWFFFPQYYISFNLLNFFMLNSRKGSAHFGGSAN